MDKKILLVEDEQVISFIYQRQLSQTGYQTDVAANDNEFNKLIIENQYDLVLLDILRPGINGLELLKYLKQNEKTKNTPVIMLTNLSQQDVIQKAFKYGASAYWIKANYSPDQIVNEVDKFFQSNIPPVK